MSGAHSDDDTAEWPIVPAPARSRHRDEPDPLDPDWTAVLPALTPESAPFVPEPAPFAPPLNAPPLSAPTMSAPPASPPPVAAPPLVGGPPDAGPPDAGPPAAVAGWLGYPPEASNGYHPPAPTDYRPAGYGEATHNGYHPDAAPAFNPAGYPPEPQFAAPQPPLAPPVAEPAAPPQAIDLLAGVRRGAASEPAAWGWRRLLRRLSFGALKLAPGPAERAHRQAVLDIQRGLARPKTIVVIQPKGGGGKTPTTVGLASALGSTRGGYVIGWDDNETRGTLAIRIDNNDAQRTTALDLLGALDRFERPDARVGELAQFVRAQGAAQFDALVSDDNPATIEQIGPGEFDRIHALLQRFYRLIVIDTGNNALAPSWQAAVNAADLLVVVSSYQRDVGYSGSWVLDHLAATGREDLARTAVTVLTAAAKHTDQTVRGELLAHFAARTQAVVEIPYDPAIAAGGPIRWTELRERTRRSWIRAAAAVSQSLAATDRG